LSRPDFSHNRFGFFLKTLRVLRDDMRRHGGDLLVVDDVPQVAFPKIFHFLKNHQDILNTQDTRPHIVSWNRDYEPFARVRDKRLADVFKDLGITVCTERDHVVLEPWEVHKPNGDQDFFQVYSPFARSWFKTLATPDGQSRLDDVEKLENHGAHRDHQHHGDRDLADHPINKLFFHMRWDTCIKNPDFPYPNSLDTLDKFEKYNQQFVTIPLPAAGFCEGFQHLKHFKHKLFDYKEKRDYPALPNTSQLSIYMKNGSLVPTQILSYLGLGQATWDGKDGATHFVKEVAWREFYYHILYHRPDVETGCYLKRYDTLSWENNPSVFKRWCEGTTGFPIVDAGMRQLNTTGWMHNRVRMIVASFLTKDLLIDWRWGEAYFMKMLLDGDLASNNGGWQWSASTGCDPQPYFRIFNPWLQAARFDPDGGYIKTFVSELKNAPVGVIHDPDGDRSPWGYPKPMVDHKVQRQKALQLFGHDRAAQP